MKPKVEAVTDYVVVTGTAASANIVKLIARVEGYLDKIHFADGALVKKDDLLFTMQQAQYKAQLQQAQAQLLAQQAALVYAKTEVARYTVFFRSTRRRRLKSIIGSTRRRRPRPASSARKGRSKSPN